MSASAPNLAAAALVAIQAERARRAAEKSYGSAAEAARASLAEFLRQGWHVLEPGTPLVWNWHIDLICQALERQIRGDPAYRKLLICVPPGTMKSLLVSVFAPAWEWLHQPERRKLNLSNDDALSKRDARRMRELITSEWYRGLVTQIERSRGRQPWGLARDQNEKVNFENTRRGFRQCLSIGASITGKRADCVRGDTVVATEIGGIQIQDLVRMPLPPRVWSMNHTTGSLELKTIQAARISTSASVVRVTTYAGDVLCCTDDHRIFSEGSYIKAADVAGLRVSVLRRPDTPSQRQVDSLQRLRARDTDVLVREAVLVGVRGARKAAEAWDYATAFMLQGMRVSRDNGTRQGGQRGAPDATDVPVREVRGELSGRRQRKEAQAPEVLFAGVRLRCWPSTLGGQGVSAMRHGLSSAIEAGHALLARVCECGAFVAHGWERERKLQDRQELRGMVSEDAAVDLGARQAPMCCVREAGVHRDRQARQDKEHLAGASHQRGRARQQAGEPGDALHELSPAMPSLQEATISVVEDLRGESVEVYDIQVEGNHNFFAGGILVHNCIVIDDPIDAKAVVNGSVDQVRDRLQEVSNVIDTVLPTRVNDLSAAAWTLIMQRLHEEDPAGRAIKEGDWHVINLQMEFEPGNPLNHPDDPRKEEGELLFPAKFPRDEVEKLKKKLGRHYYAQYQQSPRPGDGGPLKRWYWRFWYPPEMESPPAPVRVKKPDGAVVECHQRALPKELGTHRQSWDMAFKDTKDSAYVVGQVWAELGADSFLLDQVRDKMDFVASVAAVRMLSTRWPMALEKLIEDKANGTAIINMLRSDVAGLIEVQPEGGKEARANASAPAIQAGNVWIPHPALVEWVADFIAECEAFPAGNYADQVDAATQYLIRRYLSTGIGFVFAGMS